MTATQTTLPLRDARYVFPTMPIATAKGILQLTEEEIVELIDEGGLAAWDIASEGAARNEYRLLTKAVSHYAHPDNKVLGRLAGVFDPETAIGQVIGWLDAAHSAPRPFFDGREIKRALNCGRQHLIDLVTERDIPQMDGTKFRRGPGGWPVVARAAFQMFLRARIVGGV
jgi:hypothetical protein